MRFFLSLLLLVVVILVLSSAQKYSQKKRRSKEIEDRISKLDDATKKRINAMKASGMPKDAIAEKIAYVAGGKNVAKRIVDALHDEPEGKIPKKKTQTATKPKPPTASKPSANKPTATKNKPTQTKNSQRREL